MNIQDITNEIQSFDEHEFVGPIPEPFVAQAEQELALHFPPAYRQFLLAFGSGTISSESFIGLGGPQHLNIVWLTQTLRNKKTPRPFPVELLPIRTDGFGNYDCIDTSAATTKGECAVVEWLHDAGGQKGRTLAVGYFEWFRSIVQIIREIEQ